MSTTDTATKHPPIHTCALPPSMQPRAHDTQLNTKTSAQPSVPLSPPVSASNKQHPSPSPSFEDPTLETLSRFRIPQGTAKRLPSSATVVSATNLSLLEKYLRHTMTQLDYRPELIATPELLVQNAREDAQKGNPSACIVYALCLHAGVDGLKRDDHEALKWLNVAANMEVDGSSADVTSTKASSPKSKVSGKAQSQVQPPPPHPSKPTISPAPTSNSGHYHPIVIAAANAMLGDWYRRGIGCGADYNRSFRYLKRATELGDANALSALAEMYERGAGIPRDDATAFVYYRKSAEQGFVKSMFKVGQALEKGKGTSVNYMQARFWYAKATSRGHFPSSVRLATLSLDPAFESFDNLLAAKDQVGTPRTFHDVGLAYSSTKHGARPDLRMMKKWLLKAAKAGHARSQWLMGKVYQEGRVPEPPTTTRTNALQRAFYWYHKSALQGFQPAQWAVCSMYRSGLGVAQNNTLADKWQRASNRCGCQKTRPETQDQACVTGYSLMEDAGMLMEGMGENAVKGSTTAHLAAMGQGGDAGLGGMPGISGLPARFDFSSIATSTSATTNLSSNRPVPITTTTTTPVADSFDTTPSSPSSSSSPSITHSSTSTTTTTTTASTSPTYKDLPTLLDSMYLQPGAYLQDRTTAKTIPTLLQLDNFTPTHAPETLHRLKKIKTAFYTAEHYSRSDRHLDAVHEYARGFRSFEGFFDLGHYNLRLLAALSVQTVLASWPNHSDALLVDCFLNLLNRPAELGVVACTRVLEANPDQVPAAILRGGYYTRLGMYTRALQDYEMAYRLEEKAARVLALTRAATTDKETGTTATTGDEVQQQQQQRSSGGKLVPTPALAEIYYQMGVCHSNLPGREHHIASIKSMVHYLSMVGPDGRRVPDAHYTISATCLLLSHTPKLIHHFSQALESESSKFPFYPPPLNIDLKHKLTLQVKYAVVTGSTQIREIRDVVNKERVCGGCGSTGQTKTCKGCKHVRYCSVNCQIVHWISGHAKSCHPTKSLVTRQSMPLAA
ncbi:hypothetical protein DFS34DRAFT_685036 [Phlyctochytrium arcticum]|nr:hypothetical protein DFS34DRAFT_685036 [Phlyctochytrium arcticum]